MKHVNIGILAHIDAGKTSLTERLLHRAGVIDRIGRVDDGDTQTDSMELERRRGITIRSAVVSFALDDVRVNLIDTPGHPDFIAEVERALRVLDGVVLVVSAVEGVQAQTRVLMRAVARLRLPVLVFVNKIDRVGARRESLVAELAERLGLKCGAVSEMPSAELAETLSENSDAFLSAYLEDTLTTRDHRAELIRQTRLGLVSPVFFGSARTGDGVAEVTAGIRDFLGGAAKPAPDDELRASVFKIERGDAGEKIAYVRVFSGELRARDLVRFHRPGPGGLLAFDGKVTAVRIFERGVDTVEGIAGAGRIAKISGLKEIRVGDRIGVADAGAEATHFPPPGLETVVSAGDPRALYAGLRELAELDPLITVAQDDETRRITVRLYGEVQKEVIGEILAGQRGLAVEFSETRTVCVERPTGTGEAVWEIGDGRNPYFATLGLRAGPGTPGSGLTFGLAVELGSLPLAFHKAIEETVETALLRGPRGWEVVDCSVTVTRTGYSSPVSTAGDFRKVVPLVLGEALRQAGTEVLEPVSRFEIELPADAVSTTLSRLAELGGLVTESRILGTRAELGGTLPTGEVHRFDRQLPGLTRGEGLLSTEVVGYRPVSSTGNAARAVPSRRI
ncbi:translation factor GTPase family protein [Amycolatopsis sp. NPDC051071]|uniref:translation factor GTPase family protein n=1 Tax=Amycolatopsis sp. NPDC051071 TaxID=3154637 RepID=UPI00342BB2FB